MDRREFLKMLGIGGVGVAMTKGKALELPKEEPKETQERVPPLDEANDVEGWAGAVWDTPPGSMWKKSFFNTTSSAGFYGVPWLVTTAATEGDVWSHNVQPDD